MAKIISIRYCGFCQKDEEAVAMLIKAHHLYICDKCVDLCADIVHQNRKVKESVTPSAAPEKGEV